MIFPEFKLTPNPPNQQQRVMDLPPPLFRHQHYEHNPRYDNVLLPPNFIFPPYTHNRPPLPPPPQHRQPHIVLPPLLLRPPPPPPRDIAPSPMPPRLIFSSPSHPIPIRSRAYEIGLPPKPYLHRNFFPHPPPQKREDVHLRLTQDYSDRKPIPEDQIIREDRSNMYELADSRDRSLHRGARDLRSELPVRGVNERDSSIVCRSRELYNIRYDAERNNHNEHSNWGRDLHVEGYRGEKRPNIVMNNRGSELHKKMDYDGMRRDSINGWIRGLYMDRDHDERRVSRVSEWDSKLYCDGNDDGRRSNHGRCSRLRSGVSEAEFVLPKKKRRLDNDVSTCRIQPGKDCIRDYGGRKCQHLTKESLGSSSRSKEKEGFESLQTRMNGKRERKKSLELAIGFKSDTLVAEANLVPPCAAVETDINSSIVVNGITPSIPNPPMVKPSKDVVKTDLLACGLDSQPDSLGTSKELPYKHAVSEIRSAENDANDLGEVAVKNEGPIVLEFGVGHTHRNMVKRKKKAKKKHLHVTSTEMRKDSGEIINANDCIIQSRSARDGKRSRRKQVDAWISAARKKLDIGCSSQVGRCSTGIQASNASAESQSALPLKPQNVIISDVGPADAKSKEFSLNELNIPQVETLEDLHPAMEIAFLGEKGSSKEVDNSIGGFSRLDFDANGSSPSFRKKRKVASPRSNLPFILEDGMVVDGLSSVSSKHHQGSTRLAELETEVKEDSSFSTNNEASACQSENQRNCVGEYLSNRKPDAPDLNLLPSEKSLQKATSENSQINAKLSTSFPEVNNELVTKLNLLHGKQTLSKNPLISDSPNVFPGHHPLHSSNSRKLLLTNVRKSRTWIRNGNSSVAVVDKKVKPSPLPQSFVTKTTQTTQSSYIRKGNSLVRNPSPSPITNGFQKLSCSVYRLLHCTDNLKNDQASDSKTGDADASSLLTTKLENTFETPCRINDASIERIKSPGVSECRGDLGNSSNTHIIPEEVNLEKNITYIKKRSNQLVAASNSDDIAILGVNKRQASSSAGYFKSNKNQLVRASSENHVKKGVANRNSRRLVPRTILSRTCTKRQSGGFAKSYRHSKFSSVWNLHDMQSSEKDKTSVGPQKVLPHLIPWKRTTYWRSFMHALSTKPNKSSVSIASQALLLARKRGAMYTRSTHGYSLRMSKVLSVGGSSLTWSKSIERDSKKVNEETTRAVAAAVKRKKEGNGVVPIAPKSRNNVSSKLVLSVKLHPGERIYRIGSERYKMDPSRRTLHRITAELEPPSSGLKSEKNLKRSYVPRRLLIGNEEYVQIGNGNQLVRDPKKRTRVLASEKVRWSLRTARLRLARKRMYCQFFTRYGKCNKDDGKCPYTHDPSKIAVCTKFLNGLCTNVVCKLTHKVIPERMEDCSYFLKGSCSNENCPYRHVTLNSKSPVCKNFLRGHCADGNKCQKKHTYICPAFEATGSCPKESTCKLHHPKKKIEKRPPPSEQKSVRGRYFDGGLIGDADISDVSTGKASVKGKDSIVGFQEGQFPDYISLEVSDMEVDQEDDFDVLV